MADSEIRYIPINEIRCDPTLTPKSDETFLRLLEDAMAGRLPVYFGAVPFALCIPFDLDYRPDLHPIGAQVIQRVAARWQENKFPSLWVYPRGKWFIVSDDYIPLFVALRGLPDYLPCLILGKFDNDLVKDVQGPLDPSDVAKAVGFTPPRADP